MKICRIFGHKITEIYEVNEEGFHNYNYVCSICQEKYWSKHKFTTIWQDFWNVWGGLFCFILGITLLIALFVGGNAIMSNISCTKLAIKNGLDHSYSLWTGCLVNYKDFWVSPSQLVQLVGK